MVPLLVITQKLQVAGKIIETGNKMKFLQQQRGLSLTEVLITMVILGLGVVALMRLQAYIIGYNAIAQQQAEAILLTHEKIEKLRDFSQVNSQTGVKAYADVASGSESVSRANTTYTLTWSVNDVTSPKQKIINTTISWVDARNNNQSIKLSSIISENDPSEQGNIVDGSGAGSIKP